MNFHSTLVSTDEANGGKPHWSERLHAAQLEGRPASMEDMVDAVTGLLTENSVLKGFTREAKELIGQMAVARHSKRDDEVLACLDAFMAKRVLIQTDKATTH